MRRILLVIVLGLMTLISCDRDKFEVSEEILMSPYIDDCSVESKATFITEDNIADYRIHVDAYKAGTTTSFLNSNLIYEQDKWVFFKDNYKDYKYYWPSHDLDFFAYSPYNLNLTSVTMGAYASSGPSFSYAGQSIITESSQADALLTEFVCSYKKSCNSVNDNPVQMAFHHPFAKVNFKIDESIRCTIHSVKITSIKNSGNCTVKADSPYAAWETTGDFTNVEVVFDQGLRYPEDINASSHLAGPFLVVPQTIIDDAMIEVEYTALGAVRSTTVKSKLNKAIIKGSASPAEGWNPSNAYTYSLKLNGAANELFVAVKINDWVEEGVTEIEVK